MALPHRRQQLAKFIPFHELTHQKVADVLGCSLTRIRNIINGHVYPSPDEITALERLFSLPIVVLLEKDMLDYQHGPWPIPRGTALYKARAEIDRARHEAGE